MLLRIVVIFFYFFIYEGNCYSQNTEYRFSRIGINNGLSHNQVNAIKQDAKGFIWLGTQSGLNRYDGYDFKVFKTQSGDTNSISDNYVEKIFDFPGNKFWITTRNVPNIYDPFTEKFERNFQRALAGLSLPQVQPANILKDSVGNFWFLYRNKTGFYKYSADGKLKHFKHIEGNSKSPATDDVASVVSGTGNFTWIVHTNGILEKLDNSNDEVVLRNDLLQKANNDELYDYNLYADSDGDLWMAAFLVGNPRGVFYFSPGKQSFIRFSKEDPIYRLNNNIVTGITQDADGFIWIGTDHGGVNIVNKKDMSVRYLLNDPTDNSTISQNSIFSVYKDNTGIIWLGTFKQGVNYYNASLIKFALYRHLASNPNSLSYEDINRFIEDDKGNLWIGSNGGGLIYFDRATEKFITYRHNPNDPNSLSNDVVVSLCIDHEKKLWVGTYYGGLDCFDGNKFTHYKNIPGNPNSISENRVFEIFEDSQHDLWIGTLSSGLDRYNREKNIFYHYKLTDSNFIHSNYVSSILEDNEGFIWVATNGIDIFDRKQNKFIKYFGHDDNDRSSLSNNNVFAMIQDSRGLIWIGTREGLCYFDKANSKFRSFSKADGLPDNTVLTLLEDNQHNIWLSTPNGLCNVIINKKNENDELFFHFKTYDESNGLQAREFNDKAAYKTRQGEMIFGGPNGFNIFNPDKFSVNRKVPSVVLTDLQIFNKEITAGDIINGRAILSRAFPETKEITLKYKENIFSIEFAALGFSQSAKDKFAYKLEGFNKDWVITDGSQRRVSYTNLDPGSYTFRVKAANSDGIWNEEGAVLKINILPPFWRTPLAYFIYTLAIVGALFLARRITLERARMRFQMEQQQKEAERIQALDAMKTKFFTNISHEFRTPLSLILSPLDTIVKNTGEGNQKKQLQLIQRNARRLLNLVNQLLDFRKMEVQEFKLQLSKGDIIRFVKDIVSSFSDISEKKNIELVFSSDAESFETFFDRDKLEKILFNLLSNAFKYTPANGNIHVNISYSAANSSIYLSVKDSGIGIPAEMHEKIFERFFQHTVPDNMLAQGSGIGLAITKEFVKLHNGSIKVDSEPEKGTCFTVTLPVKEINETVADNLTPITETILAREDVSFVETPEAEFAGPTSKKPIILLVEDNEDFRFYLKDNLKQSYEVVEAVNGKEGWDKIKQLIPDLIVSDIMMPLMNGIELSKKIKSDPRTSHIPVVLLTAMSGEEIQLEGYQAGINDYIVKPFTFEILASRLKNLVAMQRQLRKNFQKQLEVNPGEITVTPVDEQFMKNALAAVEKNMDNPEFTVEELSRELFLSRVALYKKLLSLTGKTPIEFIRVLRMKRGAQLLEKTDKTVAEVAYEVGFNNPKNFAKYFKEEFNILPSQYIAQKRNGSLPDANTANA